MLVQLGARAVARDVVDLVAECHVRIRRFLELAARLASAPGVEPAEVKATAGQIRRYFAEAFPLHLADEEQLVLPRLQGRSEALDDALARMHAQHEDHAPLVGELIAVCAALHDEPRQLVACAERLARAAEALRAALEPHLATEECEIFPALRALPQAELAAIEAGMRARRDAVLSRTAQIRRA